MAEHTIRIDRTDAEVVWETLAADNARPPLSAARFRLVAMLYDALHDLHHPDVTPSYDGTVTLEVTHEQRSLLAHALPPWADLGDDDRVYERSCGVGEGVVS